MPKEKTITNNMSLSKIIQTIVPMSFCLLLGFLSTFIVMLLESIILSKNECIDIIPIFSYTALLLGCFICGFFNTKFFPNQKFIFSLITGFLLILILFILNTIIFKNHIIHINFIKYTLCIFFCILPSLIFKKAKKSKRKH